MKLDWYDTPDLAVAVLGLPEGSDEDTVEQALADKFEVSFDMWHAIVEALVPFTIPAKAALSGGAFHGFVKDGAFIVKAPAEDLQHGN